MSWPLLSMKTLDTPKPYSSLVFFYRNQGSLGWDESKVDGPWGFNWTVQTTDSRRSYIKVDGMRKWTVRDEKLDGPNE